MSRSQVIINRDDKLQLERFHLLCCPLRRLYPVPFCLQPNGGEEEITSTDFRLTVDTSENRSKAGINVDVALEVGISEDAYLTIST